MNFLMISMKSIDTRLTASRDGKLSPGTGSGSWNPSLESSWIKSTGGWLCLKII